VFSFNADLFNQLSEAHTRHDAAALAHLWGHAQPLNSGHPAP
jgi:hypothetical protein